jgi:hypothetical protein
MKPTQGQQITTLKGIKGTVVATDFSRLKPLLVRFSESNYEILSYSDIKEQK